MSTTTGLSSGSQALLKRLQSAPHKWQFAQAIRTLLNTRAATVTNVFLVSDPGYAHTSAELTNVRIYKGQWQLSATLPSLTGINGVLPFGYQDQAHWLSLNEDNTGLQDFYELFNQRVLLNTYKAMTRYQLCCRFEEGHKVSGSRIQKTAHHRPLTLGEQLCSLMGVTQPKSMPTDHLVRYAGLLGQKSRSPELLCRGLRDYLQLDIQIAAVPLQRKKLEQECRSCLAVYRTPSNTLGAGALLGSNIWLPANKIVLRIFPRNRAEKERIEKDSILHSRMLEMCRLYLSQQVDVEVHLQCTGEMVSVPVLSKSKEQAARLGSSHRLRNTRNPDDQVMITLAGKSFAPQNSVSHLQ